ncbi:hypothetical protein F5880DRAFT_1553323 [Lentinula raphanica]|nr:hypothetical protein F5880DRAFT_1553323 [Lentinula raphanica]
MSAHKKPLVLTSELIQRFQDEYRRKGTVAERREWIKANRDSVCTQCKDKNVPCVPNQEIPCCEACRTAKRNGKCSRSVEEKCARLMRSLNIDEETYNALLKSYHEQKPLECLDHDLVASPHTPSKKRPVKVR